MMKSYFLIFAILITLAACAESQETPLQIWGTKPESLFHSGIQEWKKTHPGMRIEYRQFATREQYHQVLRSSFELSKGPDVFFFSSEDFSEFSPFIAPTGLPGKEFSSTAFQGVAKNNLLYGYPVSTDTFQVFYHQGYFPDGIPQDFESFGELLQSLPISGIAMGTIQGTSSSWDILSAMSLQTDQKTAGAFYRRFSDPKDPLYNWKKELGERYPSQEKEAFIRGSVASIAGFASEITFLESLIDEKRNNGVVTIKKKDIGLAPFPVLPGGKDITLTRFEYLTVSQFSKFPKDAWDVVRFLTKESSSQYTRDTYQPLFLSEDEKRELKALIEP